MDKDRILIEFMRLLPKTLNENDRRVIVHWLDREDSLLGMVYHTAVKAGHDDGYRTAMMEQNQDDQNTNS